MLFYALSAICSVAAFGFSVTGEYTLPVSTCKRDAADNSACLKRALEKAWPQFIADDIAIGFVNEFWPPLYRVMLPVTSKAWEPWLISIINKLFSKVSFSKVFL